MSLSKIFFIGIGSISFILGVVGAFLPLLPSFPFLLLAGVCFAKSSKRLDAWFKGTKVYKKHLESYVRGSGMCKKSKYKIMFTVTAFMAIGFVMMGNTPVGRMILVLVWLCHVLYFVFGIKTKKEE